VASEAAITKARKRLGAEPIRRLFEELAKPVGKKTEILFKHEGFVNDAAKESHNKGWSSSFDKLEKFAAKTIE